MYHGFDSMICHIILICPLQPARHYIPGDGLSVHLLELSKLPTNYGYLTHLYP